MARKVSRLFLICTAICLLTAMLLSIPFFSLIFGFIHQERMAFGLSFDGKPLTGLSEKEALALFEAKERALLSEKTILLRDGEKTYPLAPASIALKADTEKALEEAYGVGRTGSPAERIIDALQCTFFGHAIELKGIWNDAMLTAELQKTAKSVDQAPREGSIRLDKGAIRVLPPAEGRELNIEAARETLLPKLRRLRLPQAIDLSFKITPPKVPAEMYASINTVLSEYSTAYIPGTSRGENIEIAAEKLSSHIILPGEEFSFNTVVGKRAADEGYQDAPVIIDGKVLDGIGGGVCQVSSTLYNAVLLAGLTPTARSSHYYPSGYVPAGLDATVAYGVLDFCFRNDLSHSVYLISGAQAGELTVAVLGSAEDDADYALVSEITGPNPTVDVYRVMYQNGEAVESEYLHTDDYDIPKETEAH